MNEQFARTELLLGSDAISKLQKAHVAVFGVGGVGGYTVEALVRAGIGELTIVDNDVISESNINRQIIALHSTIGRPKVDVIAERALDINPNLIIHKHNCFFLPETAGEFDFSLYDYVADCVDTVTAKLSIIEHCKTAPDGEIPVISCMGTGNKLNPMSFEVADLSKTSVCPLARVMRRELNARRIKNVKCVYSREEGGKMTVPESNQSSATSTPRHAPASISFVPPAAGLLIAKEIILEITER